MLPSWSEFWGRIGECWAWVGNEIDASGLSGVPAFVLTVVVPAVIYSVAAFGLAVARSHAKHFLRKELSLAVRVVLAGLADMGLMALTLVYMLLNYGVFGPGCGLGCAGVFAGLTICWWLFFFYLVYIEDAEDDRRWRRSHRHNYKL